jgi:signal transduction histidine kinase
MTMRRADSPHAARLRSAVSRSGAAPAIDPGPSLEGELILQANADRESTITSSLERRLTRLAFDLHDGALQVLAALATDLASARLQILPVVGEEYRERVAGRLDDLQAQLLGLDKSLRSLVQTVRGGGGGLEALDTRIAREVAALRDETGIEADLEIVGSFSDLTESRRIAIFRIVQEALSNVREHSGAHHVRVRVAEHGRCVEVSVEDDGCGFELDRTLGQAPDQYRFGLMGMQERVRLLGGNLVVETAPGNGTRVSFALDAWDPSGSALGLPSDPAA